jgi:hypothetical protein
MFRKLSKKRLAAVASVAALAITGAAVAYFTGGTGSVTGSGTVGTSTAWSVTTGTPSWSGTLPALYPGAASDTEYLPFTVTNAGKGNQSVTSVTPALPTEANGDVEDAAGHDIPGCLASWFTVAFDTGSPSLPVDLPSNGTYVGKIDLTMKDVNTSQNACQNAAPAVTITAS